MKHLRFVCQVTMCMIFLWLTGDTIQAQDLEEQQGQNGPTIELSGPMLSKPLHSMSTTEVPSTLYTIYSNLGPSYDRYDVSNGPVVGGAYGAQGLQWIGVPFTPSSDAEITEIETAVSYVSGFNGVTISLNEGHNSLPGVAIYSWNLTKLPRTGECCKLNVAKSKTGLKVSKGVQYWIVARTKSISKTTDDEWRFNYKDAVGPWAYLNKASGDTWVPIDKYPTPAFGVFGVKK
jgi:hypothetical protein